MTAVHEIGHWAGLFHTFENGCNDPGDEITDTAYEANSAAGCPLGQKSSCEHETRFNPVQNYMDYSDDACMKAVHPAPGAAHEGHGRLLPLHAEAADAALGTADAAPRRIGLSALRIAIAALGVVACSGPAAAFKNLEACDIVMFASGAAPSEIAPEAWLAYRDEMVTLLSGAPARAIPTPRKRWPTA